jgi:hypothetical protein
LAPLDRFLKIEGKRPARDRAESPPGPSRFTDVGGSEGTGEPAEPSRSGGEPERFSAAPEPPKASPIRLREDDGGQPFIRCRLCHYDNPIGAAVCTFCDADLTMPAQRSFNEALWDRTQSERVEYRQAVERLEEEQRQREAQYQSTMRELERLRREQLSWGDASLWELVAHHFRRAGTAIARWLVRTFPNRRERIFVVAGTLVILNLLTLWWVLHEGFGLTLWGVSVVVQIASILGALERGRSG